jgi:uncharacterized protein YwqG
MGETAATLIASAIIVPLVIVLIYFAFRNLVASARNVRDAVNSATSPAPGPPLPQPTSHASNDIAAQMTALWQEQAKKSDDAHKASIRAHVDRKVPPISDDGRAAIERGRKARLAIKHVFPPRLPQRSMSYLGGLPIVPEDFDWPTLHNAKGLLERLNFMAQIDCSDLPPGPARELFPDRGYLYFFAPMSLTFGSDAMHFVARYEPRQATQKWTPLDMPFTGKIRSDDPMDVIWRGARTHYDRVEIQFGWLEEPSDDEVAARANEGHAFQVADKIRTERLDVFHGLPAAPDPLLSAHHAPKDALWIPYQGFPVNWRSARIVRKFVEAYHREETQDVADRLKALGDVAADHPEAQRLRTLQRDLSTFGSKMSNAFFPTINAGLKEFDAPPVDAKEKILTFLEDLRVNGMPSSKERRYGHQRLPYVINQWLAIAAIHGAEGGLTDPAGAALIGRDVVAALAHRHAPRKHQMLGEGEVVQVAADEMKDRYLLLLQLGPDPALNWTVGEMGPLQYWITPEDLAAKRFENTVLTIEAY